MLLPIVCQSGGQVIDARRRMAVAEGVSKPTAEQTKNVLPALLTYKPFTAYPADAIAAKNVCGRQIIIAQLPGINRNLNDWHLTLN